MSRRDYGGWPKYVSTAEKKRKAEKKITRLLGSGVELNPVEIEGRKIARTFWGEGWCSHLESFSDYANRLPRGRSYIRSGMVCHLAIEECCVDAIVSGNRLYNVKINIEKLAKAKWAKLKKDCTGEIGSLLELLQGKLSEQIITVVTDRKTGIFPLPGEIDFDCNCPDWADMCKHVAAALYGVGRRLDESPELLFLLRGVNLDELITAGAEETLISNITGQTGKASTRRRVNANQLEDIFGIDLYESAANTENEDSQEEEHAASPDFKSGIITGKEITTLRQSLDLSPKDFALLLKVSTTTIYNWEKAEGPLKLHEKSRRVLSNAAMVYK